MKKILGFITLSTLLSTHIFSAAPMDIEMMTESQAWHAARSSAAKNRRLEAAALEKDKKIEKLEQTIRDQRCPFIPGSLTHTANEAARREAEARQELTNVLRQLAEAQAQAERLPDMLRQLEEEQARVAKLTATLSAAQARIAELETRQKTPPTSPKKRTFPDSPASPSKVTVTHTDTRVRTTVLEMHFVAAAADPAAPAASPLQDHGQVPRSSSGKLSDTDVVLEDVIDLTEKKKKRPASGTLSPRNGKNREGDHIAKKQRPLSRGEKAAKTRKENASTRASQGTAPITGYFQSVVHVDSDDDE